MIKRGADKSPKYNENIVRGGTKEILRFIKDIKKEVTKKDKKIKKLKI